MSIPIANEQQNLIITLVAGFVTLILQNILSLVNRRQIAKEVSNTAIETAKFLKAQADADNTKLRILIEQRATESHRHAEQLGQAIGAVKQEVGEVRQDANKAYDAANAVNEWRTQVTEDLRHHDASVLQNQQRIETVVQDTKRQVAEIHKAAVPLPQDSELSQQTNELAKQIGQKVGLSPK